MQILYAQSLSMALGNDSAIGRDNAMEIIADKTTASPLDQMRST
jgi:hypothetical protein